MIIKLFCTFAGRKLTAIQWVMNLLISFLINVNLNKAEIFKINQFHVRYDEKN